MGAAHLLAMNRTVEITEAAIGAFIVILLIAIAVSSRRRRKRAAATAARGDFYTDKPSPSSTSVTPVAHEPFAATAETPVTPPSSPDPAPPTTSAPASATTTVAPAADVPSFPAAVLVEQRASPSWEPSVPGQTWTPRTAGPAPAPPSSPAPPAAQSTAVLADEAPPRPSEGSPAAWLPDPGGAPDTLRYWDGHAWTDYFAQRA
ncbi:MAG: DUF2510 domain-containing protein [Acidimicrobiales bacterium]